jgi:hypothetical protein
MRACNQLHAGSDMDVLWAGLCFGTLAYLQPRAHLRGFSFGQAFSKCLTPPC